MRFSSLFLLSVLFLSPVSFLSAQTENTVDILYQGETYTHPFYKGRSLWTTQSQVTLMAVPNIKGVNSKTLFYKWSKNGTVLGNVNGVGRESLSFIGSALGKPEEIKIEILSSDKAVLASNTLVLTPREPEVLVYELNPLYGYIFNREVSGSYKLSGREISFASFPLFFSATNRDSSDLKYTWITGSNREEGRNAVTYRTPENSEGKAGIKALIDSAGKITQSGEKEFFIEFSNNSDTGI